MVIRGVWLRDVVRVIPSIKYTPDADPGLYILLTPWRRERSRACIAFLLIIAAEKITVGLSLVSTQHLYRHTLYVYEGTDLNNSSFHFDGKSPS